MFDCAICNHPALKTIEDCLRDWRLYAVPHDLLKWRLVASRINDVVAEQWPDDPPVSPADLEAHAECERAAPLAIFPEGTETVTVTTDDGVEQLPVPTPRELANHVLAIGLRNILKYPDMVKPSHMTAVLKAVQGVPETEELLVYLRKQLQQPTDVIPGPFAPPDFALLKAE